MLQKSKQRNRGFTIIEVLIVLAIAGLIMLIVFLAVPALQRNQRNTARKNDASRIATAVANYVSNNNGTVPTAANWAAGTNQGAAILSDAGTLNQYNSVTANNAAMTGGRFGISTGAVTPAPTVATTAGDAVQLVTGAQCGTTPGTTVAGTNSRQMAILYTLEPGSGANFVIACVNI